MKKYITLKQASAISSLSTSTLRKIIKNSADSPFIKVGQKYIVAEEDFQTFLDKYVGQQLLLEN